MNGSNYVHVAITYFAYSGKYFLTFSLPTLEYAEFDILSIQMMKITAMEIY